MSNQYGYSSSASGPELSFGYPPGVSVVDIVPPHIKHLIHPHWSNFPPVNPMWHFLLGIIYIIMGSLATFGEFQQLDEPYQLRHTH